MKIKLVFDDWRNGNSNSVYQGPEGIGLIMGDFHSGTTFAADIDLDADQAAELRRALEHGFRPVFYVVGDTDD